MVLTLVSNELKKIFIAVFNLLTPLSLAPLALFLADGPILYSPISTRKPLVFLWERGPEIG